MRSLQFSLRRDRRLLTGAVVLAAVTSLVAMSLVALSPPAVAVAAARTHAPQPGGGHGSGGGPTAWSVTSHPSPPSSTDSWINAVSCVSSSFCMGVGAFLDVYGEDEPLAEEYAGTTWSIAPTPSTGGEMESVSCTSSSFCVAVGVVYGNVDHTLIETWNGSTWSMDSSPDPSSDDNLLFGVSCVPTNCVAVGQQDNASNYAQSLVERSTNGTTWSVETSVDRSSTEDDWLNAVSCLSSNFCMAVGGSGTTSQYQTFAEDSSAGGQSWSLQMPLVTSGSASNDLYAVSCTSSSACLAVGDNITTKDTLSESWNGSWAFGPQPQNPSSTYNDLYSVVCSSATSCVAAGDESDGHNGQTLVETLSGGSWTVSTTTNPGGPDNDNFLYGIGCWSTGCAAGGEFYNGATWQTLGETNSGSGWVTDTSGNASSSFLKGVSCLSSPADWCMAVGTYTGGNTTVDETQAEISSGGSWNLSTTGNVPSASFSYLEAVSCTSSSACVAVGGFYSSAYEYDRTLAETYNGGSWTISYPQNPGTTEANELLGVSCWTSLDCAAVGYYYDSSSVEHTLAEYTTDGGSSWTQGTSPSPGSDSWLNGVSCTASACVAVGADWNGTADQTVVEYSTDGGQTWTQQTSPDSSPAQDNYLDGVSCSATSLSSCVAVGDYYNGTTYATLAEYSTDGGTTWAIAQPKNPGTTYPGNVLYDVSCSSVVDCVGVGSYSSGTSYRTLVEYTTDSGKDWTQATSPNAGNFDNELLAVSCSAFTQCVASGYGTSTPDNAQSLIETGTAPAPVPTKLAVTKQPPAHVKRGTKFTVKVAVEYSSGKVDTASTASVSLALSGGAKSAKLQCKTNPLAAAKGVATFSCSVSKARTGYKITASSSGLTKATSKAFKVTS